MHAKMKQVKCVEKIHAGTKQNAWVQFTLTTEACMLFVQTMMHMVVDLSSHVYMYAFDVHFMSSNFCAHTGYVPNIFRNVSSHVVATWVYSQV